MRVDSISVPLESTTLFVIDPQRDFVGEDGVFARHYGLQEMGSLIALPARLDEMVNALRKDTRSRLRDVLVTSTYADNQFGVPGLEDLCTQGNTHGRQVLGLGENDFSQRLYKNGNSVTSGSRQEVDTIMRLQTHSITTGATLTSCVGTSADTLSERSGYGVDVVIPLDVVAFRTSHAERVRDMLARWEESDKIHIVDSWRDIRFEAPA